MFINDTQMPSVYASREHFISLQNRYMTRHGENSTTSIADQRKRTKFSERQMKNDLCLSAVSQRVRLWQGQTPAAEPPAPGCAWRPRSPVCHSPGHGRARLSISTCRGSSNSGPDSVPTLTEPPASVADLRVRPHASDLHFFPRPRPQPAFCLSSDSSRIR